jgi:hypothetical protein
MIIQQNDIKELGQLTVLDQNNQAVILSNLWKDKKTVLVFVRHFG